MSTDPSAALQASPNVPSPNLPLPNGQGRTAIITGANIGLGFQTALQLAQQGGIHIILACRSKERAEAALKKLQATVPTGSFEIMLIDMGNLDSIRAFSDECHRRFTKLDLLCNNAGVINLPLTKNPQGFEMHMATNYFGPFALIGMLLDLLQAAPGSRIVNVSSLSHRMADVDLNDLHWERRPFKPIKGYAQSKLAATSFTLELDRRLKANNTGVMALMAHPGFSIMDTPPATPLARAISGVMVPLVMGIGLVHTPVEGARCTVHALTSPDIRGGEMIGPSNFIASAGKPALGTSSKAAHDPQLARALWDVATAATGVRYLEN